MRPESGSTAGATSAPHEREHPERRRPAPGRAGVADGRGQLRPGLVEHARNRAHAALATGSARRERYAIRPSANASGMSSPYWGPSPKSPMRRLSIAASARPTPRPAAKAAQGDPKRTISAATSPFSPSSVPESTENGAEGAAATAASAASPPTSPNVERDEPSRRAARRSARPRRPRRSPGAPARTASARASRRRARRARQPARSRRTTAPGRSRRRS